MDLAMHVLQGQIQGLVKKAERGKLNPSDSRILNDAIRTLSSVQRRSDKEEERKQAEEVKARSSDEISKLSKKELLELVLPLLEDRGVTLDSLKNAAIKE
jgi:hypothetical protein